MGSAYGMKHVRAEIIKNLTLGTNGQVTDVTIQSFGSGYVVKYLYTPVSIFGIVRTTEYRVAGFEKSTLRKVFDMILGFKGIKS